MDIHAIAVSLMLARWTFAKTMVYVPHYYTLRKDWVDGDFLEAAHYIQEHGLDEFYMGKPYKYIMINEFKYWSMDGLDYPGTDLFNRKPHHFQPEYPVDEIIWVKFP
jgi:hypothetical protein